ncbi:MAG: AAA family ATPase, partial [bacterium]
SILIMTSNLGTREATQASSFGFSRDKNELNQKEVADKMREELQRLFRPEFINRLDEIIIFRMLDKADIVKILDIYLNEINGRLQDHNLKIELSAGARDLICEQGYSLQTGARPLRRAVERLVEDPLAEEILRGSLISGQTIHITRKGKSLSFAGQKETSEQDNPVS